MSARMVRWLLSRGVSTARRRADGGRECRLTIVRHHRVYGEGERPLYRLGVSERVFAAQLELLHRLGLPPVTVREGVEFLDAGEPGHRVAMSFDDGYRDNVERALPLLNHYDARATFFLTAGWMESREVPWWDALAHALEATDRPRLEWAIEGERVVLPLGARERRVQALRLLLPRFRVPPEERARRVEALREALGVSERPDSQLATWEEAAALARGVMEVGAHTLSHPPLSRLPAEEQRREIEGSAALIRDRLGVAPAGLAYPGGDHDATTVAAARASRLRYAVTSRPGSNRADSRRYELRRRGLSEGACLGPSGRFSRRLAIAELLGAFDGLRGVEARA